MKPPRSFGLGIGLVAVGVAGVALDLDRVTRDVLWFFVPGVVLIAHAGLQLTYRKSGIAWPADWDQPRPLRLTPLDYLKAAICWLDAFKRTYVVEPGLYYLGDRYDRDAPLLVTSNYLLSVLLVVRRARPFNARLLVIDTDGINVWCSAGKGAFSNRAILAQLGRYDRDLLTGAKWLRMVLPKLAFSGVDLRALRTEKIRPIIGPVYSKDLTRYLGDLPLGDRDDDRVIFGLQSRVFTWLPGFVQYLGYGVAAALIAIIGGEAEVAAGIVGIAALLGTAYPILFPWIPGERFAVKGLWLGAVTSLGLGGLAATGSIAPERLPAAVLFTFAVAVFVGLSYTGNSAVSNYSSVRKETARFLPLNVLLLAASVVVLFVVGGVP